MKASELNSINEHAFAGADGSLLRKGTIYATIQTIDQYNQLIKQPQSEQRDSEIAVLCDDLLEMIPMLEKTGLFNLFKVESWLRLEQSGEGRALVGLLFLQTYPQHISDAAILSLLLLVESTSAFLQPVVRKTLSILLQTRQLSKEQEDKLSFFI